MGRSPLILGVAFLGVLVIWGIYSSSGVIRIASPATMAQIQSLPPVHSFIDLEFMFTGLRVFSGPVLIGLGAILLLVRSAVLSLLLALVFGSLGEGAERPPWREELSAAWSRAASTFQYVFAVEAVLVITVYALYSILGLFFGALGLVLALLLGLYLLVLAPVVAASERLGIGAAMRLSVRAARLRGPQQLTLALLYVFVFVLLVFGLRSGPSAPATPSFLVWTYVLFATYLHLAVLTAVAYRWLLVRDVVGVEEELAGAPRARRSAAR